MREVWLEPGEDGRSLLLWYMSIRHGRPLRVFERHNVRELELWTHDAADPQVPPLSFSVRPQLGLAAAGEPGTYLAAPEHHILEGFVEAFAAGGGRVLVDGTFPLELIPRDAEKGVEALPEVGRGGAEAAGGRRAGDEGSAHSPSRQ